MNEYIQSLEKQNLELTERSETFAHALSNIWNLKSCTSARLFVFQLHDEKGQINLSISATIYELYDTLEQIHRILNAFWQQDYKQEFELFICYGRNTVIDYVGYKLIFEGKEGPISLHQYNVKTKHSWNTFKDFLKAFDAYLCQHKSMHDKYYEYRPQRLNLN
jgi:hypothetical protein